MYGACAAAVRVMGGGGANSVTEEEPIVVPLARLDAVTVTVCCAVTIPGAV